TRARDAENRDLGRVDDGREGRAADAAEARDRETAALHVRGRKFAGARFLRERAQVARELINVLAVGVAHHRHHEPAGRIGREAQVQVLAHDEVGAVGVELGVEAREFLQRLHAGAHDESERRELDARGLRLVLEAGAQLFQLGDIRHVELRDVRNVHPASQQTRPGNALDARQRLHRRGAELRKVDRRNRGQRRPHRVGATTTAGECALDERLDVIVGDAVLETVSGDPAEIHAELARDPSAFTVASRSPVLTLPPLLAWTFSTTPLAVEGTSMAALSDSRVTSGVSSAMLSPGFTSTSMTATSLKLPRSGTRTSTRPPAAFMSRAALRLSRARAWPDRRRAPRSHG